MYMNFPEILKKLRKERGLSQNELAQKVGLTGSAVGYYELDKRKPDYEIITRLSSYFEVSCDYLLGISEEKRTADEIKQKLLEQKKIHELFDDSCKREVIEKILKLDNTTVMKINDMIDIMLKK
ncbi:MAG: helix-turn-helix domain-containing protein [bacterium]